MMIVFSYLCYTIDTATHNVLAVDAMKHSLKILTRLVSSPVRAADQSASSTRSVAALLLCDPQPAKKPRASKRSREEDDDGSKDKIRRSEFVKARREVLEAGAAAFEGRVKRVWEAKRLASLGAEVKPPSHKMPRNMLIGVVSKQRHLEKRRQEKVRAADGTSGASASARLVHGARRSKAEAMASRRRKATKAAGVSSLDSGGTVRRMRAPQ